MGSETRDCLCSQRLSEGFASRIQTRAEIKEVKGISPQSQALDQNKIRVQLEPGA